MYPTFVDAAGADSCCACSQGPYMQPTMVAHGKDLLGTRSQRELQSPQSAVRDAKELPEHMVASVLEICLKAHISSLELHCAELNRSWSCGQASPRASHAGCRLCHPQQLLSNAQLCWQQGSSPCSKAKAKAADRLYHGH